MIPLNKPYWNVESSTVNIFDEYFAVYNPSFFYSSREGLNYVYKKLFEERGPLRVAVSPLTCFIALYPIVVNGHTPVFVDINSQTLNMNEDLVCGLNNVDVVQTIHLGGNPVDMSKIMTAAKKKNWIVVEDCAQALGSTFDGRWVGGYGDYSVFSAVKNFHCWMGGILLSNGAAISDIKKCDVPKALHVYKKLKIWLESNVSYKNDLLSYMYEQLLKVKDKAADEKASDVCRLLNGSLSTEICKKMVKFVGVQKKREENAMNIIEQLNCSEFHIQKEVSSQAHSNRNRLLFVSESKPAKDIIVELRRTGIAANNLTQSYLHGYQEHISSNELLSQYYTDNLPVYDSVFSKVVAIPCSAALTDREIDYIVKNVKEVSFCRL